MNWKIHLILFYILSHHLVAQDYSENCIFLTLESGLSRALNYNRQLKNVADNTLRSQFTVDAAENLFELQMVPHTKSGYVGGGRDGTGLSVGGGVDFNRKFTTGNKLTFSPSILRTPDRYHTDIKAIFTQPLLRGFGSFYQMAILRTAQYGSRSACRNLYLSQIQLIIRTISSLYEVVKTQQTLEHYQESFNRVEHFSQAAKWKEKIGLADSLDVYRAQIELEQSEDNMNNAEDRLGQAQDILRDILAFPLDLCIKLDLPMVYTKNEMSLDEAIELGLSNRIEIAQALDNWQENWQLSRVAEQNLYPELNLVLNYSNCGRDEIFTRSCSGRRRESTWGIGFTTSTDFNMTSEKIAYDQSILAMTSSQRNIEQTKTNVILDVRKAFRNLEKAYNKIEIQEKQIHTAQGGMKLAELKFERGLANNFDLIQAEKSLVSAQNNYLSAVIEHIIGEYQFLSAIGLLCDKPL